MNPPQKSVGSVFDGALELLPEQRAAYLEQTCAGDEALRQRVELLLRAHDDAGTFMEGPTADRLPQTVVANLPPTEKPGDRIGRYKLLQQIGEGGCGVVYMADQEEPVKRRVALKVIKLGMDTKQVIARFEAERQALAMMDHPNIAKVLDAGATETGRPYFVMELVRGIKITEYCDQQNLSTVDRLKLFTQVCGAVQHAHQKGIIHRDLKPSNILVTTNDGVAVPKVIDFGIAKATLGPLTDKTLFTAFEQFIGTPAYMSPEQAVMTSLDIDTRSDIYSLGVLLYELLTGKTPFDATELLKAGLDEMRRTIQEKEPPKPSTRLSAMLGDELTTTASRRQTEPPKLIHTVRGDLDWIVMKCLEKERGRRYETANGLSRDVQRHLDNEPVVASPPGKWYRFRKLVRRNKGVFAAVGAVAAALIVGLGISTWLFFRERASHRQAVAAEKKSQIDAHKSDQIAEFLQEMLTGIGPSVALGRDTKLLQEILDKTTQRMGQALKDEPEVEVELRSTIARVYLELGKYDKAEALMRRELALRRQLVGNDDPQIAISLGDLGIVLQRQNKLVEAESVDREDLELNRKLLGNEHPESIGALGNLAIVLSDEGKLAEAEQMDRQVLALRRKLSGHDHPDVVAALNNLGNVLLREGKLGETEALFREGLALRRKLFGNEHPKVALSLHGLQAVLAEEGKLVEAESTARELVAMQRKLLGNEHPDLATALNDLATILVREEKPSEAEPYLREALAIQRRALGNDHPYVATSLDNLASTVRVEGDLAQSESLYREALAIWTKQGPESRERDVCLNNLAATLRDEGKLPEAEATIQSALASGTNLFANNPTRLGFLYNALGMILKDEGKLQDSETSLRRALEERRKMAIPDHPDLALSLYNLARLLCQETQWTECETLARESLSIYEKSQPDSWLAFSSRSLVGEALVGQNKLQEAEPLLVSGYEGLKRDEQKLPRTGKARLEEASEWLSRLYETTGRADKAAELRKQ